MHKDLSDFDKKHIVGQSISKIGDMYLPKVVKVRTTNDMTTNVMGSQGSLMHIRSKA